MISTFQFTLSYLCVCARQYHHISCDTLLWARLAGAMKVENRLNYACVTGTQRSCRGALTLVAIGKRPDQSVRNRTFALLLQAQATFNNLHGLYQARVEGLYAEEVNQVYCMWFIRTVCSCSSIDLRGCCPLPDTENGLQRFTNNT